MFAGFAADGKAAGDVGAGSQPALHGIANGHVLVLHDFTDFYAGGIFLPRLLADVGEVVIEDHGASVHGEGKDEVRVHDAFVGIDHEIRVDPKVESAALARGGDVGFGFFAGRKRAGLEAGALEIFDGVAGVLDDAGKTFVGVGDVVAAVEIVVHVHFPVAVERVDAAVEKLQFFREAQARRVRKPCRENPSAAARGRPD